MNRPAIFLLAACSFVAIARCGGDPASSEAETLAKTHCAACHAWPSPELLDRNSWQQYVLPRMGVLMGVLPKDSAGVKFIETGALEAAMNNPSVMRREAAVSKNEWAAIRNFYLKNAPETLSPMVPTIDTELPQLRVKFPDHVLSPPSSVSVKIDGNGIFLGDVHSGRLYRFDQHLTLQNMATATGGAVCLNRIPQGDIVTLIGSFSPTDQPVGSVVFLSKKPGSPPVVLLDSLRRPVHSSVADLDGDGRFDLVTCEFGKWTGNLSWWKNDGKGHFERHILRNMPGAIHTELKDLDGDGRQDVVALFGQGDEGIFIYYNRGGGRFDEVRALQFPPSYGSSYFSFFDYNGDGHHDIIYTCGDNADFPPIWKPYHGIRIFQNDGDGHFEEVFFYPMQGAYAAIPADFDLDGDLDLAAISFFPDFEKTPEAAFVFLENRGGQDYYARTFPSVNRGRWIVMDAGDLDGDGDTDLVLGSLALEVVKDKNGRVDQWVKDGIPFVVLENLAK